MAKTRTYRWTCPECGSGRLAPKAPGKMDPRRFCLICSAKPGVRKLVARTCPVLATAKAEKEARKKAAAKRKKAAAKARKEADHAAANTHDGMRMDHELARLWELCRDAVRAHPSLNLNENKVKPPHLRIRRRITSDTTSRYDRGPHSLGIGIGRGADVSTVKGHLLLCAGLAWTRGLRGTHNRALLRSLGVAAYDIDVGDFVGGLWLFRRRLEIGLREGQRALDMLDQLGELGV